MRLEDAREHYYFFSGKVSDIVRQLAFAAIAIIWMFRMGNETDILVPSELMIPLVLVVVGLALDLLHYLSASICWGFFQRKKEKLGLEEDSEFKAPRYINWPALAFFWLKSPFVVAAYVMLGLYLAKRIEIVGSLLY